MYLGLLHPTPLTRLPHSLMPAIHSVGGYRRVLGRRPCYVLGRTLRTLMYGLHGFYTASVGLLRKRRALHIGVDVMDAAPFDWGCRYPTFHFR